jgi:hypothetical protein
VCHWEPQAAVVVQNVDWEEVGVEETGKYNDLKREEK